MAALTAAALAAGYRNRSATVAGSISFTVTFLASAFLLETFLGFVTVVVFLDVVFLEETLGVAVFLTVDFEAIFPLGFLDTAVFFGLSAASLELVFLELSVADFLVALAAVVFFGLSAASLELVFLEVSVVGFFTALATVVFFCFSLVEGGFLVVTVPLFVETGFLF